MLMRLIVLIFQFTTQRYAHSPFIVAERHLKEVPFSRTRQNLSVGGGSLPEWSQLQLDNVLQGAVLEALRRSASWRASRSQSQRGRRLLVAVGQIGQVVSVLFLGTLLVRRGVAAEAEKRATFFVAPEAVEVTGAGRVRAHRVRNGLGVAGRSFQLRVLGVEAPAATHVLKHARHL